MKIQKIYLKMLSFSILAFFTVFVAYFSGCSNSTTNPTYQTDEQYLKGVVSGGYNSDQTQEDNLMSYEKIVI